MNTKSTQKPHTDEKVKSIRKQLSIIMADEEISQADIVRQTKLNPAKLSGFINDKYKGDNSEVSASIEKWITSQKSKKVSIIPSLPEVPDYYETPTSNRIIDKLTYAQNLNDICFIYGASGVSKTATLRHYVKTRTNVWYISMRPSTTSLMACLVQIAEGMGLTGYPNNTYQISQQIEVELENSQGLLIVDEAQNASIQALDEIRSWHDNTGVGIAFSGNTTAYTRFFSKGKETEALDRLRSRFGAPYKITGLQEGDIEVFFKVWKITNKGCQSFIRKVAMSYGGHLRTVTKLVRLAYINAGTEPLDIKVIKFTWKDMGVVK